MTMDRCTVRDLIDHTTGLVALMVLNVVVFMFSPSTDRVPWPDVALGVDAAVISAYLGVKVIPMGRELFDRLGKHR